MKLLSALVKIGAFFETNLGTIPLVNQVIELDGESIAAISFGKKKNNPVLLISGWKEFLYVKQKFFDLESRKQISELEFIEKFFEEKLNEEDEIVIGDNENDEIVIDLHVEKACGGMRR